MQQSFIQLLPVFVMFGLGVLLRVIGFVETRHGEFLLKFMFFITLPSLIFLKLLEIDLDTRTVFVPLTNIGVSFSGMLFAFLLFRLISLKRKEQGTVLISSMILNNSFMFPFILAMYGDEAFAYAVLFDFGNALLVSTVIYAMAFRYGEDPHTNIALLTKPLKIPLVWSIIAAITCNLLAVPVPEVIKNSLSPIAAMTNPLILISLGILLSTRLEHLKLVFIVLFIRMGLGLVAGVLIAKLFQLEGIVFVVAALCAASPVGFNAVTYSVLAKLDIELGSSIVSASILAGLIWIPLLMYLMPWLVAI